jgi:HK97 family phage portal protein
MSIWDKTLGRIGYKQQLPNIEIKAGESSYSGAFASGSYSMGFTSFNGMREQLNSYEDWVYIAARTVAEECATIELRAYLNRTKVKNANMGAKLIQNPRDAAKYLTTKVKTVELDPDTKEFVYRKDAPQLEELETNPLLDLLAAPNPFMTKNEFLEISFLHLELTGNAFWAILERTKGQPSMLFPLIPSQMSIIPDANKFIAGYVYRVNGQDIPFDVDDIIHHKYANPTDMRSGYSAVQAGSRVIDTDSHMAEWNRKTMYNDARISGFLTTDTPLDEKVFKRVKSEFNDTYGGTANAYKVALLEGGMDFKPMSLTPKDMDFQNARAFNRDQILALFGVPKALVGLDASMSRANADAAEYGFSRYRIKPKMQRMANRITEDLAPQFDKRLVISFTDPVPENKEYLLTETQAALGMGGSIPWVTPNEERAKRGDPLIPGGDELLVPNTFTPLGKLLADPSEQEAASEASEEIDTDKPQDDDDSGDDDSNNDNGDNGSDSGSGAGETVDPSASATPAASTDSSSTSAGKTYNSPLPAFPKPVFEAAKSTNPKVKAPTAVAEPEINQTDTDETPMLHTAGELDQYLIQRNKLAKQFEISFMRASRDVFNEQKQEVIALINIGYKGQAFNTLNKKQQKAALGDFFSKIASAAKWTAALTPVYKAASAKSTTLAVDVVANPGNYGYTQPNGESTSEKNAPSADSWSARIQQYFTNRAGTVSKGIDAETDKQLRASLSAGIQAGEDRGELLDRVESVYGAATGYRADRIARTESQTALNYAATQAWSISGLVENYIWLTSANPCPICITEEHHTAKNINGFTLGEPPIHPNCECEAVPFTLKSGAQIGVLSSQGSDDDDDD